MTGTKRRIGLVEALLLVAGVSAIAFGVGRYRANALLQPYMIVNPELNRLEAAYGPGRNSENGEEWILRDIFQDERDGVFVDVGANDYKTYSNTFFLETQLGWSGIAVDPQTSFAEKYAAHRPKTRFVPLFVSDVADRDAVLFIPANSLIASSSKVFAETEGAAKPITVKTTTLDDILERAGVTKIDFLSMDIELHEPAALRGFSVGRYRPRVVCIEAHPETRQAILDYFQTAGYVIVGKYLRADSDNLWFRPVEPSTPR